MREYINTSDGKSLNPMVPLVSTPVLVCNTHKTLQCCRGTFEYGFVTPRVQSSVV